MEMTQRMMADPAKLGQAQMNLWQDYMRLWQSTAQRMLGQEADPVATPDKGDRRFKNPEWDENELFDFVKQSYLLTARWMQSTVKDVEGLDDKTAQKVDFYTRQFRSEEHTSELQSLMRISYAVFCLKKKKTKKINT